MPFVDNITNQIDQHDLVLIRFGYHFGLDHAVVETVPYSRLGDEIDFRRRRVLGVLDEEELVHLIGQAQLCFSGPFEHEYSGRYLEKIVSHGMILRFGPSAFWEDISVVLDHLENLFEEWGHWETYHPRPIVSTPPL